MKENEGRKRMKRKKMKEERTRENGWQRDEQDETREMVIISEGREGRRNKEKKKK